MLLKNILLPKKENMFIWFSALYLLFFLFYGKISAIEILFAYFIETIIIGIFNALKMFCCAKYGNSKGYGFIFFFLVHYGFFVAIQSIFGFALFSIGDTNLIKEPFQLVKNYTTIMSLSGILYALPALIFTQLGKLFFDFIANKKYMLFTTEEMLFKPYMRIVIQQFVVLFAFFFMVFSNAGLIAAVLLILFRCFIDLVFEAIRLNSKVLDILSEKLANEKTTKEEIKKQLILFTE